MALITAEDVKARLGGGVGVWRDDLAEILAGALVPDDSTEIAAAAEATGIANNADQTDPVVLVTEFDALVAIVNDMRDALIANGIASAAD